MFRFIAILALLSGSALAADPWANLQPAQNPWANLTPATPEGKWEPYGGLVAMGGGYTGQWYDWSAGKDWIWQFCVMDSQGIMGWWRWDKWVDGKPVRYWCQNYAHGIANELDRKYMEVWQWKLGPASCGMVWCSTHRQWTQEKVKVPVPEQKPVVAPAVVQPACPTGTCPPGG